MVVENLTIEGRTLRRYHINYGGVLVCDCDTAREAWDKKQEYERLIRPVTDPANQFHYRYFDDRKELDIVQFRARLRAEEMPPPG